MSLYPVGLEHDWLIHGRRNRPILLEAVIADAERALVRLEAETDERAGPGTMRRLERDILLDTIDRKWREHLYEMDYLKEGIGLRAMAQRDPVVVPRSDRRGQAIGVSRLKP